MKREYKTLALLSAALLLVGCNDSYSSSIPSESGEGDSSSQITDSTYRRRGKIRNPAILGQLDHRR